MFKNRKLTVTVDKVRHDPEDPHDIFVDEALFEKKADAVLSRLEEIGVKVFAGFCVYIILDTWRQVQVARATNPIE